MVPHADFLTYTPKSLGRAQIIAPLRFGFYQMVGGVRLEEFEVEVFAEGGEGGGLLEEEVEDTAFVPEAWWEFAFDGFEGEREVVVVEFVAHESDNLVDCGGHK